MTFGADGVSIYQKTRLSVTWHILYAWAPHSIRVHYMAHKTNLVVHILSHFAFVTWTVLQFFDILQIQIMQQTHYQLGFSG
jgi:hypothetical protein